jgi:predicted ester cyclase
VINGRDVDAIDTLLSEGFVHNGEKRGREGQKPVVRMFLDAFPDLHDEIELIVAEGDLVAAHQRWTGTQEGEIFGVAATGKKIEFVSTAVLRCADGEIAEAWDVVDVAGILSELGAA